MSKELRKPKVLNKLEIKEKLKTLPNWDYKNNKISKTFEFASFSAGIKFITKLAPFCNQIDHHPDIQINYKKILFELTSYSIGAKVTKLDFQIAKKIEEFYKQFVK